VEFPPSPLRLLTGYSKRETAKELSFDPPLSPPPTEDGLSLSETSGGSFGWRPSDPPQPSPPVLPSGYERVTTLPEEFPPLPPSRPFPLFVC